jgi:hypothetical protein
VLARVINVLAWPSDSACLSGRSFFIVVDAQSGRSQRARSAHHRLVLLRATWQEIGPTRDTVIDAAVQRLELSQKQAAEAYTLAERYETNP